MIKGKKKITEELDINLYDREIDGYGSNEDFLEEVEIDKLIELLMKIKNTYPNYKIKLCIYDCEDLSVYFHGTRLETDKEFEARKDRSKRARFSAVEKEKRKREEKIKKEKIEYERLKNIYG